MNNLLRHFLVDSGVEMPTSKRLGMLSESLLDNKSKWRERLGMLSEILLDNK